MQEELNRQYEERVSYFEEQQRLVQEYAKRSNKPVSFRDANGNLVLMVGINDNGLPIYKTTDNAGAAVTTGATKLREGGGLGLNLQGEGVVIGIWDGGVVDDHIEYNSRILSREGEEEDNHASHVTGTIMASGINPLAKGMAPKATAFTFDFNNDETEMLSLAKPDQTSILLSNHSYGLISGWRFDNGNWQWFGDAGISAQEDYKFGYYSSNARFWDNMAFNAPYYLMVKSAGNDRSDTGPVNRVNPSDCNGGTGYDCLSDISTSKNILVVGAVAKVTTYSDPSSIVMSSFSSWGPTDDGRIKPDLVGAGVNIFSTTASSTNDQYGVLSGTSMATPNVTGSLALLQELYRNLNGGNYMRSATLRALAIHSAKEAGISEGPDYSYGWGLLDDEAAAQLLLATDNQNVFVEELVLNDGQIYEKTILPKSGEKITVTIAWTDPAGTPVGATLDPSDIMLVNDLDLRITDDAGNEQLPWILDPANPSSAATKGDNKRDNVEKIEFSNPEPRNYKIVVKHKKNLQGGQQNFSMIISHQSQNDPRTAYYWIGENGEWANSANWSLTSGGPPANSVPGINDRVFVDENSFSDVNQTIILTSDASCNSITWLAKGRAGISLASNTLNIDGGFVISSTEFFIATAGVITFTGGTNPNNSINLYDTDLQKAVLVFEGNSTWTVTGDASIGEIQLNQGFLKANGVRLIVSNLNSSSGLDRGLDIRNSEIDGLQTSIITAGLEFKTTGTIIKTNSLLDSGVLDWDAVEYDGVLSINSGTVTLKGNNHYNKIELNGGLVALDSSTIDILNVGAGSEIHLQQGKSLALTEQTFFNSDPLNQIKIVTDGTGKSSLQFEGHFKLCFENLLIDRVNISGSAVINAGINSSINDSDNWNAVLCEDVLFPDFEFLYTCEKSLAKFIDKTSGTVTEWNWNFGDISSASNTSTEQNPHHIFSARGLFVVTLTAKNGDEIRTYSQEVEIVENSLPENKVIVDNESLFSFKAGGSYQWYWNDEEIQGANERSYDFDGQSGVYFVVIANEQCNIPSAPTIITALEYILDEGGISVYPNPAHSEFNIRIPEQFPGRVDVVNALGQQIDSHRLDGQTTTIVVRGYSPGTYWLKIFYGKHVGIKKLIISK